MDNFLSLFLLGGEKNVDEIEYDEIEYEDNYGHWLSTKVEHPIRVNTS